jgi:metal-responsive CopG/Arc/MetJ family transcriptional regulator
MPDSKRSKERRISINVPMPESLMLQLDYLIEHKAIRSKSSFIRDAVAKEAQLEMERVHHIERLLKKEAEKG